MPTSPAQGHGTSPGLMARHRPEFPRVRRRVASRILPQPRTQSPPYPTPSAPRRTATICNGNSTTIQAALTGTGPWNLTWSDGATQNGVASSPATRSVSPSANTTYTLTALSDANCTAQTGDRTASAVVTVNTPPSITSSPSNRTVCSGSSTTFAVTASGTSPTYQWRKNGVNISGATASTYTISSVQAADAASSPGYDCVVSVASCSSVTS